jgi:uncharacterized BrkB/YihY/UPF0761 family membrane protein
MKIYFVILKHWTTGEVFIFVIATIVFLVINSLIGGLIRALYYYFIANEEPPELSENLLKGLFTLTAWGILGSIFLMYITNLWNNLGPR